MRKRKLTLLAMLLALSASADSVRRLEVFIDSDPGAGNGSAITIPTSSQGDTVLRSFSYTIPPNLSPGRHTIHVRALADTAGVAPRWSLVQRRDFFVPERVVPAEYFIDIDPGAGAGSAITVPTSGDTANFTASIVTPALTAGKHILYVRTRTNAGRWGMPQRREFQVRPVVTAAEYFIDSDPGAGNGTALTVGTVNDTVSFNRSILTPPNLGAGRHRLYVRSRSAGAWSISQVREFEVLSLINAAEYFFDTDPGIGNGTALNVSLPSDTIQLTSAVSTTGLSSGLHRLFVRSRSANGRWGLSAGREFYVVPRIVEAEYFWDNDPGIGAGIALAVPTPGDTVNLTASLKAPCLSPGRHHLYVRTKDQTGSWALSHDDTVTFTNPAIAANVTYPGPGPYGTPVKLRGDGGTGPYRFTYNGGPATADSIFLPPNGASVVFTATDSCGYSATANLTTPASPTLISGGSGGSGTVVMDAYRHWAWVLNASGQIIAAVKDDGRSLGTVSIDYLKNNSGTVRQFPGSSLKYLDRNWLINSSIAPAAAVGLQLFALDSEFNALATADPLLTSKSALRVQKYDGPNEDLSPLNNSGAGATVLQLSPDSVVSFSGMTASGNGYALAFSVGNFSEFYQSRSSAVPLGNPALALQARRSEAGVELFWTARGPNDIRGQNVERGESDGRFATLETVPANGTNYLDRQPLSGVNHYRIRAMTADGRELYSNTVSIRIIGGRLISVYPNPAREALQVDGLSNGDAMSLYDVAGSLLIASQAGPRLDLRNVPNGVYMLQIRLASGELVQQRVEVMR